MKIVVQRQYHKQHTMKHNHAAKTQCKLANMVELKNALGNHSPTIYMVKILDA